ncbi:MAG: stage III sporulation protein AG [Roseburia sp.]
MEHNFSKKIIEFLQQKKWKKMKKSDWLILVLAGVLILILAMPVNQKKKVDSAVNQTEELESEQKEEKEAETYAEELEERLEKVLEHMEGVGKVQVMITLSDLGEDVLEKDCVSTGSTTTETDSSGGSRTITESEISNTTVYVEKDGERYPYLQKEMTPRIEGIVVVAEGGDQPTVISNISDAAMALFSVEAHKVKVVKMCMQEE